MKLRLSKKFGWIHVRGGALVKVVEPHVVHTDTRSTAEYGDEAHPGGKWVFCERGDFAMELVLVNTGKVLGHSYLSGPAIQLNRYNSRTSVPKDDWYEPAALGMAALPDPRKTEAKTRDEFADRFTKAMVELKFGPLDVAAWRGAADSMDEARHAANWVFGAWDYEADDGEKTTTHLIGMACVGKAGRPSKHGEHVQIHIQPPKHQSEKCVSNFQSWMVLEAAERAADYASHKEED